MFLGQYTQPVNTLKGVGPALTRRFENLGIDSVSDLLRHYPREYQDRRQQDPLSSATRKDRINALVRVRRISKIGRGYKKILKVVIEDETAEAALMCFGRNYLEQQLIPGARYRVSGRFVQRHGELQCSDFDFEAWSPDNTSKRFGRICSLYPLTDGLKQETVRRQVRQALSLTGDISDELPEGLCRDHGLLDKAQALRMIHFPESFSLLREARRRIVFEELLVYQLRLTRLRNRRLGIQRALRSIPGQLKPAFLQRLPFPLTEHQLRALGEIETDLLKAHPGARLLQGDVGCGKTLVAFAAALMVIEAGEQVAFLAPTELLARQHAENAARLLEPLGIRVAFLTGGISAGQRKSLGKELNDGRIDLVVGTHALFSAGVAYSRLGLVIIDEQQRFGVRQRQAIVDKGSWPDLLLLSATPIPRTLALSLFGDLDISEIRQKPAGRKKVITHLTRAEHESKVYDRVRQELQSGGQAYFVYPVIEEADSGLKDAEGMYALLKDQVFPEYSVGLIHARLPEDVKKDTMDAFVRGDITILVATSVLEVGVDVPGANCMVIEQAERFGLSSLHQLRGRVGRGPAQAYAFLVYANRLTESGIQRLKVIKNENDGFRIAEQDLQIRGPGEFLGTRQAGMLKLGLAEPLRDHELLLKIRREVERIAREDSDLLDLLEGRKNSGSPVEKP